VPSCPACGRFGWWGRGVVLELNDDGAIERREYPTDPRFVVAGWACRECGYEVLSPSELEARLEALGQGTT
jgi:hypothetical protein